ncbi:ATP-binding cassette domain-containing protein [Niabella ginsengisoli]|uniref:ATP-binding cassette domain-containing protein n=1 Tax=Niabella ginsengisoli TaxID=522298 RepID=UPI0021D4329B|nr:ATP-binding cassette domain-containing protein [Niabella ginsengisoli]
MMLILQNISYIHPDKEFLFSDLHFTINKSDKIALIGNNGTGKSTLLKIIAGELEPLAGQIITNAKPYYVPQVFGQFNHLSIAQALQVEEKLRYNVF